MHFVRKGSVTVHKVNVLLHFLPSVTFLTFQRYQLLAIKCIIPCVRVQTVWTLKIHKRECVTCMLFCFLY